MEYSRTGGSGVEGLPVQPVYGEEYRYFTKGGNLREFFAGIPRREVDVRIAGTDGETVFEQLRVVAPESWSDMAVTVAASKYFRGHLGTSEREVSVFELVRRVASTIATWGLEDGYLANREAREVFEVELAALLIEQRMAFNSPVWFNVGIDERPQCSACFINSVADSMDSILGLAKTEGKIFKNGSGAGVNLSSLRGRNEPLSGGGTASGPVPFMRGYDAFAGAIKSGGKTRRAAKLVCLDVDHPDIEEFVTCKRGEEEKVRALLAAGYAGGLGDDSAQNGVFFQNANHSVRVTDEFMRMAAGGNGSLWGLRARTSGRIVRSVRAAGLLDLIAETAWACGDPGLQFEDTINGAHTCPNSGKINASNPCAEFVFLDDSACNLASLNLRKFQGADGKLEDGRFIRAVELTILAQEILVDRSSYPTDIIERNSRDFRPLGLGYANLGAFLMAAGLPYDSVEGRNTAAGITGLMTGAAYRRSAEIARSRGPFAAYRSNEGEMIEVVRKHRSSASRYPRAQSEFELALDLAASTGFRNSQVTLLAPTGTIAFLMDCDTTGIEPDLSIVKRKRLSGGGEVVYENSSVKTALRKLGYPPNAIGLAMLHLRERGTLSDVVEAEDLPVFDTALPNADGRFISWEGHLRMVEAVQPLLSGSVSKTVNLPGDATAEDVREVYLTAWRNGLKAISVYRDGSKGTQPLEPVTIGPSTEKPLYEIAEPEPPRLVETTGVRERLPETRPAVIHKIDIAGHEGYVIAGTYPDGRLGELFVNMAKSGSTVSGLLDAWATMISISLQYGVPYEVLREKFRRTRFEPAGFSNRGMVTSVLDYLFIWLEEEFPDGYRATGDAVSPRSEPVATSLADLGGRVFSSGPPCATCGSIMEPNGTCHRCPTCGTTNGCG